MKLQAWHLFLAATGWAAVGYFMARTGGCHDNCEHPS